MHPVAKAFPSKRPVFQRIVFLFYLATNMALSNSACADDFQFSGQIRNLWTSTENNTHDPVSKANQLLPGLISEYNNDASVEAELHASARGVTAIATLHGQAFDQGRTNTTGWLNELYTGWGKNEWQFSVGKKIISWDVAYGFRPNDMIQQEKRQTFITSTLIGRPVAMAEYFNADSSLALVWVNPDHGASTDATVEQAFAARAYHHAGSLDIYGFARYGQETGTSLGSAVAWVATESLELHASYRYSQKMAMLTLVPPPALLARTSPWQAPLTNNIQQAALGMTYTTEDQHSFIIEAWWDGAAPSNAQWGQWNQRNLALGQLASAMPSLQTPVAYNLAWQSNLLAAANNLRRKNLFARWSKKSGAWETAIDTLYTPEDKGHATSASIDWQGDRWHIDAGVRIYGGPASAVFAQIPQNKIFYTSATWAF
ncbi:hypothetical protein ACO0K7_16405 [Undibacterium sp. Ji67W]|uniref:hypothetical protein n=1 Tax=Undibacterium sp. Ji67W TaxID=3413042 RepID=UPI003BEF9472